MSYFNHAFRKCFLGNGTTGVDPVTVDGYIDEDGTVTTLDLSDLNGADHSRAAAPGYFGIFDATNFTSINGSTVVADCCPFIIASSPLFQSDKIGQFHGGYRETNKSKKINPRFVRDFYYVEPCAASQSVVHVGNTIVTADTDPALPVDNFQSGTDINDCCFEFVCGETYRLRIDVKGSPALRAHNHNSYFVVDGRYTTVSGGSCCAEDPPEAINGTNIMIQWAEQIVRTPYLKDYVVPVVYTESTPAAAPAPAGFGLYPPLADFAGTTTLDGTAAAITAADRWDAYDQSTAHTVGACAGIRLYGAFQETTFGNCTFQVTDHFDIEPLQIFASMVDYSGSACPDGICAYTECKGIQSMGTGESVLRDLVMSESYLQNHFANHKDLRYREITQGYDISDAVTRSNLYGRYFLMHSVPRYNNPSGTFDNDQYLLEIIVDQANATFEAAMTNVLNSCPDCTTLETFSCTTCDPVDDNLQP